VLPHPDDPEGFINPTCIMPAPSDSNIPASTHLSRQPKAGCYKLDPTQKLSSLLRYKSFVEYPCIEVYEDGTFRGTVIDDNGLVRVKDEERRPVKRRKLDVMAGRKAITGLVGEYGSEAEGEVEKNILGTLGGYGGSEDEVEDGEEIDGLGQGDDVGPEDDEGDAEGDHDMTQVDYEELAKRVEEAALQMGSLGEEEDLDWGESDDEQQLQAIARTAVQDLSNMHAS